MRRKFVNGAKWWGVMEFDPETRNIPPYTGDNTLGLTWRLYKAKQLDENRHSVKSQIFQSS